MRHVLSFNTPDALGIGEWQHQVMELDTEGRIQLWYLQPGRPNWELGHGKAIPEGKTAEGAAAIMRLYLQNEISQDEYDALLP
ncbi:hypothetical protein MycrhDRAFT_5730 [Mycolicibacterium rhodesiae JS60]|nr:hypothetical protein MycrhDRAFT_5730 [Mycolicibacterium rhodesiae JS60]